MAGAAGVGAPAGGHGGGKGGGSQKSFTYRSKKLSEGEKRNAPLKIQRAVRG